MISKLKRILMTFIGAMLHSMMILIGLLLFAFMVAGLLIESMPTFWIGLVLLGVYRTFLKLTFDHYADTSLFHINNRYTLRHWILELESENENLKKQIQTLQHNNPDENTSNPVDNPTKEEE